MEELDPKLKDADQDGENDESDSTGSESDEKLTPIEDDTASAPAASEVSQGATSVLPLRLFTIAHHFCSTRYCL